MSSADAAAGGVPARELVLLLVRDVGGEAAREPPRELAGLATGGLAGGEYPLPIAASHEAILGLLPCALPAPSPSAAG